MTIQKLTLQDRVIAFRCFELPGQPMAMHMGTSHLVNDLAKEVESLTECYEVREEKAHQLREQIIKLTKERDALMAAAKLALESLRHSAFACGNSWGGDQCRAAIDSLEKAGVQ